MKYGAVNLLQCQHSRATCKYGCVHSRCQPSSQERDPNCTSKSVRSHPLTRQLATSQERIRGYHTVEADDVDNRQSHDSLEDCFVHWFCIVYRCCDELDEAADDQAVDQEESTSAPSCDDACVDEHGEDSKGDQDDAVLERVPDAGHFEEVSGDKREWLTRSHGPRADLRSIRDHVHRP